MNESKRLFPAASYAASPKSQQPLFRWLMDGKFLPASIFMLLAVLSGALIGYLKADSLHIWRYTSDLFICDTVLQESARGFIGRDFTYGNVFGDHTYLFLLPLIPLKVLLSSKMVYLLVLLGPLSYVVSSIIFFLSVKQFLHPWKAFLLSLTYLFGFTMLYRGLFDDVHGMHGDTFAGFLAAAMTALLIWREYNAAHGKKTLPQTVGAVFFLLAFLSLKEEMAILGILFFGIAFFFRRTAFHRNMILLSGLVFAVDLVVLKLSLTPFNRTNNALISDLFAAIQASGLNFLFNNPNATVDQLRTFWFTIALICLLFSAAAAFSKRINPYSLGLFLMGLAKLFFGLTVQDFDLFRWHDFPGLVMISAAVLFQFIFVNKLKSVFQVAALLLLTLGSMFSFLRYEAPYVKEQLEWNIERKEDILVYYGELSQFMDQVDPMQVVAIPIYTAKRWVGYRYTFYPRGISIQPQGIADFAVYPINEAAHLAGGFDKTLPLAELLKSFTVINRTRHFILLKRTSFSESEVPAREMFFNLWK